MRLGLSSNMTSRDSKHKEHRAGLLGLMRSKNMESSRESG